MFQNFLAPIAHDFAQPNVAVHRDKQCALVDARGLGMGGNYGINEMIPDLDDLSLRASAVHAE